MCKRKYEKYYSILTVMVTNQISSLQALDIIIKRFIKKKLTFGISKPVATNSLFQIWRESEPDETTKNKTKHEYISGQIIEVNERVLNNRNFCIIYEKGELVK